MATVAQVSTVAIADTVDSTTVTLNSVVAGSCLAVLMATYIGPNPTLTSTGDSWGSNTIGQTAGGDTNGYAMIARAENVGAGTHVVTINPIGASAYISAVLVEVRNTPTSSTSDGTAAGSNGSGTAPASASITIAANTLLLGVATHLAGSSPAFTEAYTFVAENENSVTDQPGNMQSRGDSAATPLGAGSYTLTWTVGTSSAWSTAVAGWAHSGGAAQDTPELYGRPFGVRGQNQMRQLLAQ